MAVTLRPYQQKAIDALRDGFRRRQRRQVLCAPTGAGKTVIAAEMIKRTVAAQHKVVFVADRIALVQQTSQRLHEYGIEHGVVMSNQSFGRYLPVQVCSAQTLEARGFWPDHDLAIIDECHTQRDQTLSMMRSLDKPTIGLTATPFSRGMGQTYDGVVNVCTTNELIDEGWLVPLKVFTAKPIDMKGAKTNSKGEWSEKTVETRALPVVGDVVSEWVKHVYREFDGPQPTLAFSASVAHGALLCEQFGLLGYAFEQVSYKDTFESRTSKIERFRAGDLDGLITCDALTKGFDVPSARVLISARPRRKDVTNHIQELGRVMRGDEGKDYALVLDHAGNYIRHARITESFWAQGCDTLDERNLEKYESGTSEAEQAEDKDTRECVGCGFVMDKRVNVCPSCGKAKAPKRSREMVVPGRMVEYKGLPSSNELWGQVCQIGFEKYPKDTGRARKFAVAQYRNLAGQWPKRSESFHPAGHASSLVRRAVAESVADFVRRRVVANKIAQRRRSKYAT